MKTKYLPAIVLTVAALAFNFRAVADDGEGDTNECDIQGMEVMEGFVVLTPTNGAPTNATGVAKIDSDNEDGDESASIKLQTQNLNPGDYSLSVSLQSTGSNVFVGTFTVSSGEGDDQGDDGEGDGGGDQQDSFRFGWDGQWGGFTNCPSFTNGMPFTNCFSNWNGWCGFTNWGGWCNSGDTNSCSDTNQPTTFSEDEFDLPPDVNPTDIGDISVSDTNGTVVLEGNITNPAPATVINIQATVQLKPGADSSMSGAVQLTSTAQKGKWKHQFKLQASGATSHSTYKMNVNGKNGGAGKSTKSGQLKITKLPSHTSALRSLKLLDAKGNEAASAHF